MTIQTSNPHELWRMPVLIGTPVSLAALAGQLAVTDLLPARVGCVLARREDTHLTGPDIAGLPVLGAVEDLAALHRHWGFSVGIVSLPAGERATMLRVRNHLAELGLAMRIVPMLGDVLAHAPTWGTGAIAPPMNMSELIGRTPHGLDRNMVRGAIEGRRALVTGAGGSIGSEIARIVAAFRPSLLVLMERSENALFEIDRQIARRFPDVPRRAVLHDIVDEAATHAQLGALRPHVIFHAAAHKHVPLMEDHPAHALTNNLFGTRSVADAARACGVERFVMISTDKAVNPASTMGATKRLAENYVRWLAQSSGAQRASTRWSIVRFGNVLGSACSVLPIWTTQLSEGGPITVTDPRMTRYFMTIPEAATLVIQAGAFDLGPRDRANVYVLDMGEPVRIIDLAQRFVRMHGFEPRLVGAVAGPPDSTSLVDPSTSPVDIAITGARPGEKLHEELAYPTEGLVRTPHPGILALDDQSPLPADMIGLIGELGLLRGCEDAVIVKAGIRRALQNGNEFSGLLDAQVHAA